MKKLLIFGLSLVLAFALAVGAGAALLSPGISVLQSEVKMQKNGVAGNTVTFSAEDFTSALGVRKPTDVKITSLPSAEYGVLCLGENPVAIGDVVAAEELSLLCFTPAQQGKSASFGFLPVGGAYEESFVCVISMEAENLNLAPTTKHGEIADMAGITVFSTLCGEDGEGDALRFSIVAGASHGTVEIIDERTGAYRYTPDEGYSGRDSFSFCATDAAGNVSNVSKISVNVARNDGGIVYSDMEGSALHLAAAVLYEKDIMLGEMNGKTKIFNPEGKVTRSDFLIMAMNTAGITADGTESSFADAASFSPYERKYISAAEKLGITVGVDTEAGRCFLPDEYITDGEAALMVCRIAALCGLEFVESEVSAAVMADENYDALAVLADAEMFASADAAAELSRADTVQILYALLGYCE
jgi:hypothetical protein